MSAPENPDVRLTALVRGTVQGVGYRYFALSQARAPGLRGYARNRRDGAVEVVAEGARQRLEKLLVALRRGPSAAKVTAVVASWSPAEPSSFSAFTIRR
jgi:acylphosphatase